MLRLLKIEWNKIYYYKSAKIFTILYFVILIAIGGILAIIKPEIGGVKLDIVKLGMFNFPEIWQNITYIFAIAKIFIAVIIITQITNEFTNRTLKQNLIDGLSKAEFLKSKILTNLIFASISTLIVLIAVLVLGSIFSESKENMFKGVEYIGAYWLKLFFFFNFCMFLSFLFRKSAFALLGMFVWWIIEGILSAVEVVFTKLLNKDVTTVDPYDFYYTNYLPLNASSSMINFPKINPEAAIMGNSLFEFRGIEISYVIAVILYTILFIYLSYYLLKKRDL